MVKFQGLIVFCFLLLQFSMIHAYFTGNNYVVTLYEDENCGKEFETFVLPNHSADSDAEDAKIPCTTDGDYQFVSHGSCTMPPLSSLMFDAGFLYQAWEKIPLSCYYIVPPTLILSVRSNFADNKGQCLPLYYSIGRNDQFINTTYGLSAPIKVSARILSCLSDGKPEDLTPLSTTALIERMTEFHKQINGAPIVPLPAFQAPPAGSAGAAMAQQMFTVMEEGFISGIKDGISQERERVAMSQ
jgi:hypothetical protein